MKINIQYLFSSKFVELVFYTMQSCFCRHISIVELYLTYTSIIVRISKLSNVTTCYRRP